MAYVVTVRGVVPNPFLSAVWTTELAESLAVVAFGLLVSALLLWPAGRILRALGVVDVPNARSSHTIPTIRGAGIAVLLAWGITVVVGTQPPLGFLLGVGLIVLLGAIDDFRTLPPTVRLLGQILLSALIANSLIAALRPDVPHAIALIVLTLFLTATINSVNFMDGVNGMSVLHAVMWGITYAAILIAFVRPDSPWSVISAALAGAFLAFLPWNARRVARAFLGDAGSYGLGAVVGSVAVVTWAVTGSWVAALLPLGIYGLDTLLTVIRRVFARKSLFEAHREHVYQRNLIHTGSVLAATSLSVAATAICAPWPSSSPMQL
jgi:UDP-GlcNAc:undecaprenyl-phosphate GlcNAc-1-phosphate transferase